MSWTADATNKLAPTSRLTVTPNGDGLQVLLPAPVADGELWARRARAAGLGSLAGAFLVYPLNPWFSAFLICMPAITAPFMWWAFGPIATTLTVDEQQLRITGPELLESLWKDFLRVEVINAPGPTIRLRGLDGGIVNIPVQDLSSPDRDWIVALMESRIPETQRQKTLRLIL